MSFKESSPTIHHFGCADCEHAFQVHGVDRYDDLAFSQLYFEAEEANIPRVSTSDTRDMTFYLGSSAQTCQYGDCARGVDVLAELIAEQGYEITTKVDPRYDIELAGKSL